MEIGFFENDIIKNNVFDIELCENIIKQNKNIEFWIFPEVFDTGFDVDINSSFNGENNVLLFQKWSKMYNIAVAGSFYIKENNKIYNRFCATLPNGETYFYDKRHLFGNFEKKFVNFGDKIINFEYKGFKIRPIICYDLRFPVWCRNDNNYDILLCVSQWPLIRKYDRKILCKARAIENVCYVINVNGLGESYFETPDENIVISQNYQNKFWKSINIDKNLLNNIRKLKKYLNDKDNFTL